MPSEFWKPGDKKRLDKLIGKKVKGYSVFGIVQWENPIASYEKPPGIKRGWYCSGLLLSRWQL